MMKIRDGSVIGVCGVYGEGDDFSGGQPVKVKTLIEMFKNQMGDKNVLTVNTFNWKHKPFRLIYDLIKLSYKSDVIFMLPAHNGIKVFAPLLSFFKIIFRFKIVYSVIGGWLPQYTRQSHIITLMLKKLDFIFVETSFMKKELEEQGFNNVYIVNNAKKLIPSKYIKEVDNKLKLCFFSRVMKEKGIEDIIEVVKRINNKYSDDMCILDIYGPVDANYKNEFEKMIRDFPQYVKYKGVICPDDSVETLEKYDFQVFPTRFKTEGIPGSIIDSYAAGVPVISSKWNSFDDVIINAETGFGYSMYNLDELENCLINLLNDKNQYIYMRKNCLNRYKELYTVESVFDVIEGIIKWQ